MTICDPGFCPRPEDTRVTPARARGLAGPAAAGPGLAGDAGGGVPAVEIGAKSTEIRNEIRG
jgi:hypothetical protein